MKPLLYLDYTPNLAADMFNIVSHDPDVLDALHCYNGIRQAIVGADTLPPALLSALKDRVALAVLKYPDNGADTPALTAANKVLRAYACYLAAVDQERMDATRHD